MIRLTVGVPAEGTTYPLARRNQPQWLQVGDFLVSQAFGVDGLTVADFAERGRGPAGGEGARSIPHGNHGDNTRSESK